jgi:vacuolar iron transporter family protein
MAEKNAYIEALEQRIAALEMSDIASVTSQKRYDIPDVEARKDKGSDSSDFIRDAIIGFADGLTVPFALTAGLSS